VEPLGKAGGPPRAEDPAQIPRTQFSLSTESSEASPLCLWP
jgi:hypothetical protein